MADTDGANNPDRLDRIERIVEVLANTQLDMQQDVRILLRAQVVMGDQLEKLTSEVREGFAKLTEAQRHADERMDALILTVEDIVRGRKPE